MIFGGERPHPRGADLPIGAAYGRSAALSRSCSHGSRISSARACAASSARTRACGSWPPTSARRPRRGHRRARAARRDPELRHAARARRDPPPERRPPGDAARRARQPPDARRVRASCSRSARRPASASASRAATCSTRSTSPRAGCTSCRTRRPATAGGPLLPDVLTPREADVLDQLQLGRSNAEIAIALSVSIETVRTHARSVFRKLGVKGRRELVTTSYSR